MVSFAIALIRSVIYHTVMTTSQFSTFNERPLHAALKQWYAEPGDRFEVPVAGYVIDIVRGTLLIEIQTRNFSAMRQKLAALTTNDRVRLVHPIAQEKWITKRDGAGRQLSRRKSPKRGRVEHVFAELVSFPALLLHPNFSIEVILVQAEEFQRYDGRGRRGWRRKGWVVEEQQLLKVIASHRFETAANIASLLPTGLPSPFTTADLAAGLKQPRRLAQQMAYCLREMGVVSTVGKQANSNLYIIT